MGEITKLIEMWELKLIIGSILAVFAPFKTAMAILLVMIIIDTATGSYYAAKIGKFSSKRFRKGVGKTITYMTSIIVMRLLEVGIESIIATTLITLIIVDYLIITEAISILENLTLLDVPLPAGFLKIILKSINYHKFTDLFSKGLEKQNYLSEIDEIIDYQIPTIKSGCMRELLAIKFNEWKSVINIIDMQLSNDNSISSDLIYYRVSALITATNNALVDKWAEAGISQECISLFYACHEKRVKKWIELIKQICYSEENVENKKKQIIEKTIILLYQTIIDIQKEECSCIN